MTAGISYVPRLPAHAPCNTTKVLIIKEVLQRSYHQGCHHSDWLHIFHAASKHACLPASFGTSDLVLIVSGLHQDSHRKLGFPDISCLLQRIVHDHCYAHHVGHDLRGHANEVHANDLRRRQDYSMATDRALTDATNMVQQTTSRSKQQAAQGTQHCL